MGQPEGVAASLEASALNPPSPFADGPMRRIVAEVGYKAQFILRKHYPHLRSHDIEDILASALKKLWQYRSRYDPSKGTVDAWYLGIVWNEAINHTSKQNSNRERPLDNDLEVVSDDGADEEGDCRSAADGPLATVGEFIRLQSELDRQVLLHYCENYTTAGGAWTVELARELGVTPGSLRVRLTRIKDRLRHFLTSRGHFID